MQQRKLKSVQLATTTEDGVHLSDSILASSASENGTIKSKSKKSRHQAQVKESSTQKFLQQPPPRFILNAEVVSLQTQENQLEKSKRKKRVSKKKGSKQNHHVSSSETNPYSRWCQSLFEYYDYTHRNEQPLYHIIEEENSLKTFDYDE